MLSPISLFLSILVSWNLFFLPHSLSFPQPALTVQTKNSVKSMSQQKCHSVSSVIQSVLRIYTTRSTQEQQELFAKFFSPNVTFEDPLMIAEGDENYRVQFVSLIKLFSSIEIQWPIESADSKPPLYEIKDPGTLGENTVDILVKNRQVYRFARESWLAKKTLPEVVDLQVLTTLTVEKCEKGDKDQVGAVVRHHDVWLNNDALQWTWYQKSSVKSFVGRTSSAFLRWLGW